MVSLGLGPSTDSGTDTASTIMKRDGRNASPCQALTPNLTRPTDSRNAFQPVKEHVHQMVDSGRRFW